jgi:hypothetical protein
MKNFGPEDHTVNVVGGIVIPLTPDGLNPLDCALKQIAGFIAVGASQDEAYYQRACSVIDRLDADDRTEVMKLIAHLMVMSRKWCRYALAKRLELEGLPTPWDGAE